MKVLIQKVNGEFSNINFLTAYLGFKELGWEVETFKFDELEHYDLSKVDVVYGGIPTVDKALKLMGIEPQRIPCYPKELENFLGRVVYKTTMNNVRNSVLSGRTLFVKPSDEHPKLFNGGLVSNFRDLVKTAMVQDHVEVWASTPVEFSTEYRVFIHKGKIVAAKNYRGDFKQIISFDTVEWAISKYKSAPVAYVLDFGLINGKTLLVEANDCTSIGVYGTHQTIIANMVADRWEELRKNSNEGQV